MKNFKFNTTIASLMEYSNFLSKIKKEGSISYSNWDESCKRLLIHLSPICPHITEEIWSVLGNKNSIHLQINPTFNDKLIEKDKITLIIQINGKLRDQIQVEKNAPEEEIIDNAKKTKKIRQYLEGMEVIKSVYVPGRIVNFVVKPE